jgi:hypothetical protein
MSIRDWSAKAVMVVAAAVALALTATAADAQNTRKRTTGAELITGSDIDSIIASLSRNGFTVELSMDGDGDPMLESTDDDEPFTVNFYGCDNGDNCEYMQFVSGWDLEDGIDLESIEDWNKNRVWGRAFLDEDSDPWVDLAINLKGGVTVENLDDTVSWWWSVMRDFEDHIGWNN